MKFPHIFILILVLLNTSGCKHESPYPETLECSNEFTYTYFELDAVNQIILYNGNSTEINENKIVIEDFTFHIETPDQTLIVGKEYSVTYNSKAYRFFLTELPIVSILTCEPEIPDEPKISGVVKVLENGKAPLTSFIGIELRGGFSQSYPKKSYSLELWGNENGNIKKKVSLLGMRADDDWILDGLWNEPNRIRDYTAHGLWLDMGRVKNTQAEAQTGIDRKYCETFVNGIYKGVYYLGEKIDRKQLDLDDKEGELYKGITWANGTTYLATDTYDNSFHEWSGYEAKYPDLIGFTNWGHLHAHVDFVVNSSSADFNRLISSKMDMDNVIDYYLFLNLIYASDNSGKNIYTCKLDRSSGYFFLPWDMDGSFGNNWEGNRSDIIDQMLSNGLYDRLLQSPDFKVQTKARWNALRTAVLNTTYLKQIFRNNNDYLERNGIFDREVLVIELSQNYSPTEIDYIESWIDRRVSFLDNYYNSW